MSLHVWKSLATDPDNPLWECLDCHAQSYKEEPRDEECPCGDDRNCPACEGSGRWTGCLSAAPDDNCPECGGSGEKP